MRLTSPSESLRGQFEITGHPPLNPGITEHAHNKETLAWTHISADPDSGITGKRHRPTSAVEDNRRSSALSVIIAALNTKTLAENRHISRNRTGLLARNPFLQREETP
jgi:hypothetical protein